MTRSINRIARRKIGSFPGSVKPRITSVAESGGVITVTYTANVTGDGVDLSRYTFSASGGALTVASIVFSTNTAIIIPNRNPGAGETVTMSYVPQGNSLDTGSGSGPTRAAAKAQYNVPVSVS